MSRDVDMLCPDIRAKWNEWALLMRDAQLPYILTRTSCTWQEQVALFAQGRNGLQYVNHLRRGVGWSPITHKENDHKVTWTMNSKHIVRLDDSDPFNNCARAFDFALTKDGVPHWLQKLDVNQDKIPDYEEAGRLWEKIGGTWGGRWRNPDPCHCQLLEL